MLKVPFNWEKIKNSCREFVFIASDNDPYNCGEDQSKLLHSKLGGRVVIKKDQGHFNLEVGEKYKKFPEILEYI